MVNRFRVGLSVFILSLYPSVAIGLEQCFDWSIRANHSGFLNYDGDTIYITMPGLPEPLSAMSVRVAGVDTPEIRGQCPREKTMALQARSFVSDQLHRALSRGTHLQFCAPKWGRYGGRVVAYVAIGDNWLHDLLIQQEFGRPYDGGKRQSWCN